MSQADDLRILKFEEVALQLGYSAKHIERLVKEEDGPKVTKLSAKRRGIRADHLRQWLDRKTGETEAA